MSAVLNTAFTSSTASQFLMATPITTSWAQDITCMVIFIAKFKVVMIEIIIFLYFLERHIIEYASNLVERQKLVATLFYQNIELKRLVKELNNKENALDLDSPITKVIKVIRDVQSKCNLTSDMQSSLDKVIDLLSRNQLFLPNLTNLNIDSDVSKWLNSLITNQTNQAEELKQNTHHPLPAQA